MISRWIFFSFFMLAVGVVGANARTVKSLLEYRQEGVVIQKWDNSCGAAALATLLTYDLNYPVSEVSVAQGMLNQTEALRVRYRGGFSLLEMKHYLTMIGFEGTGYSGLDWEDLPQFTPSIVPIKVRGYDHFVVVTGIMGNEALIADPGFGKYRLTRSELLSSWTTGTAFVVQQMGLARDEDHLYRARSDASIERPTGYSANDQR